MAGELPSKRDVARALLLKGSVYVHLDPRRDSVIVPERFRSQPQLVLQIGLELPVPIPDLRVDDEGVVGTLSFKREALRCSIPWQAVFALVGKDGRGMVWDDSMPREIAEEVEAERALKRVAPNDVDHDSSATQILGAPRGQAFEHGEFDKLSLYFDLDAVTERDAGEFISALADFLGEELSIVRARPLPPGEDLTRHRHVPSARKKAAG